MTLHMNSADIETYTNPRGGNAPHALITTRNFHGQPSQSVKVGLPGESTEDFAARLADAFYDMCDICFCDPCQCSAR